MDSINNGPNLLATCISLERLIDITADVHRTSSKEFYCNKIAINPFLRGSQVSI